MVCFIPGGTISTSSPNYTNALGKFWYLSKWSFNSSSYKTLTTNANYANVSLQAIATILPNQTIDIRWNTDSEEIVMGNRTLTLIKVQ
jgi:hypothetical protein